MTTFLQTIALAGWLLLLGNQSCLAQISMPLVPSDPPVSMIWHAGDGLRGFNVEIEKKTSKLLKNFYAKHHYPVYLVTCNSPSPELLTILVNQVKISWLQHRDGMVVYYDFDTKKAGLTYQGGYEVDGFVRDSLLNQIYKQDLINGLDLWLKNINSQNLDSSTQLNEVLLALLPMVESKLDKPMVTERGEKRMLMYGLGVGLIVLLAYLMILRLARVKQRKELKVQYFFPKIHSSGRIGSKRGLKFCSRSFADRAAESSLGRENVLQLNSAIVFSEPNLVFAREGDCGRETNMKHRSSQVSDHDQSRKKLWGLLPRLNRGPKVMMFVGFLVMLLFLSVGIYQRNFGYGFDAYRPWRDNRFVAWPLTSSLCEVKHMTPQDQTGLGWDEAGRSYPLIDHQHVIACHNEFPPVLFFRAEDGVIHQRCIASSKILCTEKIHSTPNASQPLLRLAILNENVPVQVKPLALYPLRPDEVIERALFFCAKGRVGSQKNVSAHWKRYEGGEIPWLSEMVSELDRGQMQLCHGDSGGPLRMNMEGQWLLVGISHSITRCYDETHSLQWWNHYLPLGPFASLLAREGVTLQFADGSIVHQSKYPLSP